MKRDVRVKLEYVVTIDDEDDNIPMVHDINRFVTHGLTSVVTKGYVHGGAKLSMGLTCESFAALKKARKAAR